jgi:RecA-family ATPase
VGETGAGKSSLLYNVAVHAARNEPLWGIPFGAGKPLTVLYIDPENAGNWEEGRGGNCAQKLERIGAGRPHHLYFHDGRGLNLSDPAHFGALTATVRALSIQVLIADPAVKMFGTRDENDNAEADKQMQLLTVLSRETGCAVILCHHTGKNTDGNYGRGASSRLASADVGIVFRVRGEDEETDDDVGAGDGGDLRQRAATCRYQMVKNRLEGRGSLYLQMAGNDRFDRTDFAAWQQAAARRAGPAQSKSEIARVEIGHALMDGERHSREEILSLLSEEKIGRNAADEALQAMITEGRIVCITGPRNSKYYRESGREVVLSEPDSDEREF